MNIGIIFYFLGWVLIIEAVLMLLPCAVSVIYGDGCLLFFLAVMAVCLAIGWITSHKRPKNSVFYAREGFVAVALIWVVLSFFGALPFWLSGQIPSLTDALFETISGFTTTGASILNNVEGLSPSMLMWRSFTHWVGGMGVLVFVLAIMPLAGGGYAMHIMRAESPGPSVGKLTPKIKTTAKILYVIYLAMTLIQVVLLLLGGMPLFDALATSFGTAGTGGFGIKNSSIAYYDSYYLQGVVTVFMILFGINFNVYYLILVKRFKDACSCEEARVYLGIIAVSVALITLNVRGSFESLFQAFHHTAFQVGSIITTTGFSTVDFDAWPQFSKSILIGLMFVGACAGSTGGGMKVSRIIIWLKSVRNELLALIHPRSVRVLRLEKKSLDTGVIRSVNNYFIAYFFIFAASVLVVSLDNFDFTTCFTAVAATFNNIGPGMEAVGPMCNFSQLSAASKYVLMFDMLAGRLEIFPMLILFSPATWRKGW
ncbi:MAG: TrkH family potassium uptake protein [Hungatella sp.]|nr:TrkH family potassium uptake protein [Hungatella sp.]